jgi:alkyl sulfatase BDS1-like metallo-beta-lactamase superfamily hydrolase
MRAAGPVVVSILWCPASFGTSMARAEPPDALQGKPATAATRAAHAAVLRSLPFDDRGDFEDAQRGLIARPERLSITDGNGKVV